MNGGHVLFAHVGSFNLKEREVAQYNDNLTWGNHFGRGNIHRDDGAAEGRGEYGLRYLSLENIHCGLGAVYAGLRRLQPFIINLSADNICQFGLLGNNCRFGFFNLCFKDGGIYGDENLARLNDIPDFHFNSFYGARGGEGQFNFFYRNNNGRGRGATIGGSRLQFCIQRYGGQGGWRGRRAAGGNQKRKNAGKYPKDFFHYFLFSMQTMYRRMRPHPGAGRNAFFFVPQVNI